MPPFRPMKGEKVEDKDLHLLNFSYDWYLSLKLDGIRCLIKEGRALSAALKAIPNNYVRQILETPIFEGFDGELLLRQPVEFNEISSAIMSRDGQPDFVFHVFDVCHCPGAPFAERMQEVRERVAGLAMKTDVVRCVKHVRVPDLATLQRFEDVALENNYEGIMLRRGDLPYKYGKASINQGHLLKRKPMTEMEAIIVGFEEGMTNTNPAELNERGLTKRSSAKEGMIPSGTLGKLLVRNKRFGDFKVGTGKMKAVEAQSIWDNRENIEFNPAIGRPVSRLHDIIQFSFQERGTVDLPRLPIFQRFRDTADLDWELVRELRGLT